MSVFDNATKGKWIQIRVSEEQRERIKELAGIDCGGDVTKYILGLIKEDETRKNENKSE
jgi:hypothetical protein